MLVFLANTVDVVGVGERESKQACSECRLQTTKHLACLASPLSCLNCYDLQVNWLPHKVQGHVLHTEVLPLSSERMMHH